MLHLTIFKAHRFIGIVPFNVCFVIWLFWFSYRYFIIYWFSRMNVKSTVRKSEGASLLKIKLTTLAIRKTIRWNTSRIWSRRNKGNFSEIYWCYDSWKKYLPTWCGLYLYIHFSGEFLGSNLLARNMEEKVHFLHWRQLQLQWFTIATVRVHWRFFFTFSTHGTII